MHRLIKPIFWTFLFLIMMIVIDQFLVQVPLFTRPTLLAAIYNRTFAVV